MTRLVTTKIKCVCGKENEVSYYRSVCSWLMDEPNWIVKILMGTFNTFKCEKCGNNQKIESPVLINCFKGMFEVNPREEQEKLKHLFKEYELIDEEGRIIDDMQRRLEKSRANSNNP